VDVLDHLEAGDEAERSVREWYAGGRGGEKLQVGRGVGAARQGDCLGGDVESGNGGRGLRKFGGSVARAAADIQDAPAPGQPRGEQVACQMLVPQVDVDLARDHPFTGELKHGGPPDTWEGWTSERAPARAGSRKRRRRSSPSAASTRCPPNRRLRLRRLVPSGR
jgi:hypothetical protein